MGDQKQLGAEKVVGVVICTAKRPQMVSRCIASVIQQENLPDGFRHEIIVVENDSTPNSKPAIDHIAANCSVPIHYVLETQRGIPFARNRTIKEAIERDYDWMTLIDDDEQARPDWLSKLLNGALDHDAEISNGPVIRHFDGDLPDWWKRLKPLDAPTGHLLDEAPTNNTLVHMSVVREDGMNIRFDNRLTFGHEDIDFFRRAKAAGAKIIWVHDAFVEEEIPASRMTNERLLERVAMQGAAFAYHTKIKDGSAKAWLKFGPKGIRRILAGILLIACTPAVWLTGAQKGKRHFYRSYSKLIRGWAHFRGLTHFQPDYYAKIDGN